MLGLPPASAHGLRPTLSRSESAYPIAGLGTGMRPRLSDVSEFRLPQHTLLRPHHIPAA
jgi:hypothetical protein